MRRRKICLFSVVAAVLFSQPICAEEDMLTEFDDEIRLFRENLPDEMENGLPEFADAEDWLTEAGRAFDLSFLWDTAVEALSSHWSSALFQLSQLLAMVIVSALFRGLQNALETPILQPSWEFCSALCFSLVLARMLMPLLALCESYLTTLTKLLDGVTPLACTVSAASGNLNGAAVSRAALLLLATLLENLYTILLVPPVKIAFCFSIVGGLNTAVRLDTVGQMVRRFFTWLIALLSVFLTFLIGMQTLVARSADSFTLRTVKFALGNAIPLVGGALSEALGSAVGSLAVIKSSCGALSAAAILISFIPVLLELFLGRAVLAVGQGAAELIGADREGKMCAEMHGIVGYLLAVVAVASFLFLFILALLIGMPTYGG